MLSEMIVGIMLGENYPVMMMLFVLIVTSAMFVPWEAQWQGSLGFVAMGAFIANAIGGVAEANDPQQWLSLTVLMAFAVSFAALKAYYQRQQRLVVDLEKAARRHFRPHRRSWNSCPAPLRQLISPQKRSPGRKIIAAPIPALRVDSAVLIDSGRRQRQSQPTTWRSSRADTKINPQAWAASAQR
jgi:hypothetical protein